LHKLLVSHSRGGFDEWTWGRGVKKMSEFCGGLLWVAPLWDELFIPHTNENLSPYNGTIYSYNKEVIDRIIASFASSVATWEVHLSAWKVVPWSAVLQLVLLCTVYIQAQGCLCTAYQLGGDVQQPCLIIKYDVIHKTGSTQHVTTPPEEDRATAIRKTQKVVHSEPKNVPACLENENPCLEKLRSVLQFLQAFMLLHKYPV